MISFEDLNETWETFPIEAACSYKIGPFIIRISSISKPLMEMLTRGLAHIAPENASPDLTIRLWNGPKLPPINWDLIQSNGYRGYSAPPFYFHFLEPIGALSAVDTERGIAYYAVRDLDVLPWWVSGSPLQTIFHVYLREKGMQLTHCAAIANKKSGILLAGKGGSGKSSTLLSCLEEGFDTLGEDYVLLGQGHAHSVYQTAKWTPHTRKIFPSYESYIANPDVADREKALIYYKEIFPSQIALSSPIHAIVSLRIGTSPHLEKGDLRTSLQSLLLSTAMQLPHSDPRTNSLLYSFAQPLAHYRLTLGPDLKTNVALLRSLF